MIVKRLEINLLGRIRNQLLTRAVTGQHWQASNSHALFQVSDFGKFGNAAAQDVGY